MTETAADRAHRDEGFVCRAPAPCSAERMVKGRAQRKE
jgi:hypothetical protein